jgi:peptidyl-prolyl cis-trans isomerase A (cyclophilin A)
MSAYQNKVAELHTSAGEIDIRFYPDIAPNHVKNFIDLAEKGFYNGTKFHRVIPGFMIQGGDPTGSGMGGPGYSFGNEFEHIAPTDDMGPGTLAMANAGDGPDGGGTNGSQFFVMEATRGDLVRKHTMFGKCNELDVVKKITGVPRDNNDKPNTAVTINKVTFEKK